MRYRFFVSFDFLAFREEIVAFFGVGRVEGTEVGVLVEVEDEVLGETEREVDTSSEAFESCGVDSGEFCWQEANSKQRIKVIPKVYFVFFI
jgi:hypothetical protein